MLCEYLEFLTKTSEHSSWFPSINTVIWLNHVDHSLCIFSEVQGIFLTSLLKLNKTDNTNKKRHWMVLLGSVNEMKISLSWKEYPWFPGSSFPPSSMLCGNHASRDRWRLYSPIMGQVERGGTVVHDSNVDKLLSVFDNIKDGIKVLCTPLWAKLRRWALQFWRVKYSMAFSESRGTEQSCWAGYDVCECG